jgi:surface polysaccharide O-acyltransferase-like enzyme
MQSKINKSQDRNFGLDLLKIVMMFLVIAFHFSDHGVATLSYKQPLNFNWIILSSARIWGGVCNACFMLISGYFMSQKHASVKAVIKLYLEVWFYSVVCGIVCYLIGSEPFEIVSLVKMIFPFIFNQYWYFTMYLIVYLLSPFINIVIDKMSRNQYKVLILIGLVIFTIIPTFTNQVNLLDGDDQIGTFILIYLIGAYIKKYDIKVSRKKAVSLILVSLVLDMASVIGLRVLLGLFGSSKDAVTYFLWPTSKILPIVTGVSFFLLFKDLRIRDTGVKYRFIDFLSSSVFGVYLFHIGRMQVPLFQMVFNDSKTFNTPFFFPQMLVAMVSIFVVGILIDKFRMIVFERPLMRILNYSLGNVVNLRL